MNGLFSGLGAKAGRLITERAKAGSAHTAPSGQTKTKPNEETATTEPETAESMPARPRNRFLRALMAGLSLPGVVYHQLSRALARRMPKGLYGRSLMIIVMPMVILQSVIAFVFMERHWQTVTYRLSSAVTRDIAALIEVYENYPQGDDHERITKIAREQLGLTISFLPPDPLPPTGPKPFFSLIDRSLSREIRQQIQRPFWIDTVGRSNLVEIRIQLKDSVLKVLAKRSQTYASNSHIFLVWMVGTSLVLLFVAVLFLRNQIRPIQRLAAAAEAFGKGRDLGDFKPKGAREVRAASLAFLRMRDRIERQIEQRTTMLAGVSHDLRTILTRFKLELALLGHNDDTQAMSQDVDEMQKMLQAYLDFARGAGDEETQATDISDILEAVQQDAQRLGTTAHLDIKGEKQIIDVRPQAFKRCLANLVGNAVRYGHSVHIFAQYSKGWLTIMVDDDGPGIPPESRDDVFRPFYRLDQARNQDAGGTGLGLSIARDIASNHGGEITLADSPYGGLRAILRIPV